MKKESNPSPPVQTVSQNFNMTLNEVQRAFTEWDRRYREEPEKFESEAERLLKGTPETYGEACAPYFLQIVGEVISGKVA